MSPKGKIVWKGHPAGLNNSIIEEHIKGARVLPIFDLPSALSRAKGYLEAGSFGKGISELEKAIKRNDDTSVQEKARDAIEEVLKYGRGELKKIDAYGAAGDYAEGMDLLEGLTKAFKRTDLAKDFKDKLSIWKKDKKIRAEIEGGRILEAARDLVRRAKYKDAARLFAKVAKGSKFRGTRVQEEAEKRLEEVLRYL